MPQAQLNDVLKKTPFFSSRRPSPSPAAHLSRLVSAAKASRNVAHRERAANRRADAYLDERNDQVSRIEWIREQKRWEERMRKWGQKEAVYDHQEVEDERDAEMPDDLDRGQNVREDEMLIPNDEEEMEALLEYLNSEEPSRQDDHYQAETSIGDQRADRHIMRETSSSLNSRRVSQTYGSDEDDYDQLFMEVIGSSQMANQEQGSTQLSEAMDVT